MGNKDKVQKECGSGKLCIILACVQNRDRSYSQTRRPDSHSSLGTR